MDVNIINDSRLYRYIFNKNMLLELNKIFLNLALNNDNGKMFGKICSSINKLIKYDNNVCRLCFSIITFRNKLFNNNKKNDKIRKD